MKRWYNEFNRGRRSLKDEPHEGPKSVVPQNIDAVRDMIMKDRHVTYHDESWIYAYELETKQQLTVWIQSEDNLTIVVRARSVAKQMVACFLAISGHVVTVPLEDPQITQFLTSQNIDLMGHPPYSPDLAPNDFFLFPSVKKKLRGQRFLTPEDAVEDLDLLLEPVDGMYIEESISNRSKSGSIWDPTSHKVV
ncbi:uncharacterized protein LOC116347857 [Contarinia nasturtii]|uniref:uncharacterized protein LOC116347857 n=1 Tax=Contarinia nasturtii TaxID=265458 RepID=UPI0012D46421|nr:uncharacterized protein LOC116347857 [Contarinia nasturtii]